MGTFGLAVGSGWVPFQNSGLFQKYDKFDEVSGPRVVPPLREGGFEVASHRFSSGGAVYSVYQKNAIS